MIKAIVAYDNNRVIGNGGKIPWHLKGDFANFKKVTSGHTVVMGRKTFDSIGKPLPNRKNVVLTRDVNWKREGVEVIHNYEDVLGYTEDVFILGGEEVYRLFLPHMKKLYVTLVDGNFDGDAKFLRAEELPVMQEVFASELFEENGLKYRFLEYEVK
jgi:dihydrofolate reductase